MTKPEFETELERELYEALQRCVQYIVVAYQDAKRDGLSESTLKIAEKDHAFVLATLAKARKETS